MEGGSKNIGLLAGINDGLTFESSQYVHMNIFVHIEDHIIDIVDDETTLSPGDGYIKASEFTISGRHTGVTTLHVSARQQSGLEILSQSIKVEVYAPPILHPHDIILVPGASYVEEPALAKITRDSTKITVEQVHGLMSQLVHFVNRDSLGLANDFLSMGFIPEGVDIQLVSDALHTSFSDGSRQSRDFQEYDLGLCSSSVCVCWSYNCSIKLFILL